MQLHLAPRVVDALVMIEAGERRRGRPVLLLM